MSSSGISRTTEEVIEEYLKDRRSDIPDKRVQEIIVRPVAPQAEEEKE